MLPAFLAELRERDVQLWADGEQLRCAAPAGVLTPELRAELASRKTEILSFLRAGEALALQQRAIVPLQSGGTRTPIFGVAGHNGDVFCYRALARYLGDDQPFFGLEPPGLDGASAPLTRIADLAAYFITQIRAFRPVGPYIVAGYCAGGATAFEVGRELLRGGADVTVVLLGSPFPTWYRFPHQQWWRLARLLERAGERVRSLAWVSPGRWRQYLERKRRYRRERRDSAELAVQDPVRGRRRAVERATLAALRRYAPPSGFAGRLRLFWPSQTWLPSAGPLWRGLAEDCEEYFGPEGCAGDTMLLEPHAREFADLVREALRA